MAGLEYWHVFRRKDIVYGISVRDWDLKNIFWNKANEKWINVETFHVFRGVINTGWFLNHTTEEHVIPYIEISPKYSIKLFYVNVIPKIFYSTYISKLFLCEESRPFQCQDFGIALYIRIYNWDLKSIF